MLSILSVSLRRATPDKQDSEGLKEFPPFPSRLVLTSPFLPTASAKSFNLFPLSGRALQITPTVQQTLTARTPNLSKVYANT